jgi:LPS export ABC transporter protein LptC
MGKSLNFRRILGFIILLATLATSAVIIRYFVENAKKDTKNNSKSVSADITMKTIHFTESEQNRKKWELFARSGIYDKPKEKTSLEEVRFIVERDSNKGPVTVTAKHGEYLHAAKTVHLSGTVLAKTENGMTFETTQINYDSATKRFTTKEKIRLTDEALTVEGVGMDLFVDSQQAIVKSQVDATVYPGKRIK